MKACRQPPVSSKEGIGIAQSRPAGQMSRRRSYITYVTHSILSVKGLSGVSKRILTEYGWMKYLHYYHHRLWRGRRVVGRRCSWLVTCELWVTEKVGILRNDIFTLNVMPSKENPCVWSGCCYIELRWSSELWSFIVDMEGGNLSPIRGLGMSE